MLEHVAERGGQFILRRWGWLGFEVWSRECDAWLKFYPEEATCFDSPEAARKAYAEHNKRKRTTFRGWL